MIHLPKLKKLELEVIVYKALYELPDVNTIYEYLVDAVPDPIEFTWSWGFANWEIGRREGYRLAISEGKTSEMPEGEDLELIKVDPTKEYGNPLLFPKPNDGRGYG